MKKYFVFAIAALGMIAGCQKNQIETTPVENDDPVAVQFGINAPSLTVSKTKASVNEWGGQTVYVYGFTNNNAALGSGKYDVTAPFINAVSAVANPEMSDNKLAKLEVYNAAAGTNVPYYYSLNDTYDFYGFYLGGITPGTPVTATDKVSYAVTIDGSQDLMYAKANQVDDVNKAVAAGESITADDAQYAYSAWAARRGVQPTLVFNHALTRFNFYIQGKGTKFNTVTVDKIQAKSPASGVLTVVGSDLGYVADNVAATALDLKNADGSAFAGQAVTATAELAGDCIMVAPNMEEIQFVVETSDVTAGVLPQTTITLTPDMIDAALTEFAAGTMYDVTIIVYGPEAIEITAELKPWVDGGDYEYDPDNEMKPNSGSIPSTPVTTEAPVVLGTSVTEEDYNAFYDGSSAPSYAEAVASGTLPWVGFKFDERATDAVFYVKCTYDGTPVTFAERSWYTKVDANTVKVPVPEGCTVVSFEAVNELGLSADIDVAKVVFTVTE